ncbi:MAG: ATP-binding protein [Chitinophagales bacterium]
MPKYTLWIFILLISTNYSIASNKLDSLNTLLSKYELENDRQNAAIITKEIGQIYFHQVNYKLALQYFHKGLDMVLDAPTNIPGLIAPFYFELGEAYSQLSKFPEAIAHYKKAIITGKQDDNSYEIIIKSWQKTGVIYMHMGDYEQAYTSHLKIIELSKDNLHWGYSYYMMGRIYFHQKQFDESLKYYKKSLEIWVKTNSKGWIYTCNDAIGVLYGKKQEYDKWFEHSQIALQAAKEANYAIGIAYGTHNLAGYYQDTGCFEDAMFQYQEALKKMLLAENKMGQVKVLRDVGSLYIKQEAYSKAITSLQEALDIAASIGTKPLMSEIYQLLYQAYDKTSNLALAYEYQDKYLTLNNSLIESNNTDRIIAMQNRHELQKQEMTIAELQQKQEIKQLYPKASLAVIIVLVLIGLLLTNRNRLVHFEHKLLTQNNIQAEKERELLAESNRSLEYFATVAHSDLQVPLKRIHRLIDNIESEHKDDLKEDGKEYVYYISDGILRMSNLITDLLSYAKLDSRKTTWKLSSCNIPQIIEDIKLSLVNVIEEKKAEIIIENLPSRITANPTTLTLLLQNLISNGLKFTGDKNPVIHINCVKKEDEYVFSIQDNGIGIAAKDQKRIFEIFQRLHTQNEYKGTGIGLATCQKIVTRHKGEIRLTSELGYGTTFYFTISRKLQPTPTLPQANIRKAA